MYIYIYIYIYIYVYVYCICICMCIYVCNSCKTYQPFHIVLYFRPLVSGSDSAVICRKILKKKKTMSTNQGTCTKVLWVFCICMYACMYVCVCVFKYTIRVRTKYAFIHTECIFCVWRNTSSSISLCAAYRRRIVSIFFTCTAECPLATLATLREKKS